MSEKSTYQSDPQKIYASMSPVSSDAKIPRRYSGDSSQLTNWIFDSGATYHMTPEISDYKPGSLVETDKYIEVAYGHYVTSKQTGEVQIKMRDNDGNFPLICYITYYSLLTCTMGCFPLLR